ncbi:MAG: DUF4118 domain-containing protein [Acidimicrobiia bacterium]
MGRQRDGTTTMGIAFGGGAPIAVAAALVSVRGEIDNANVALLLTVVVVAAAAIGGRVAGAVAAVSAVLSFNFFHTQPYLSLAIDSGDDVETTVLLLVVGLAVGQLARWARTASAEAKAGRDELARIRRLSDQVARGRDAADVIQEAQTQLSELLGLESAQFEAPPYASLEELPVLERNGGVAAARYRAGRDGEFGLEWPAGAVSLPVLARGREVGRFVLHPRAGSAVPLEPRIVAIALADQVGASLAAKPQPFVRPDGL